MAVTLPYCLTISTEGILRDRIAKILLFFLCFQTGFSDFLCFNRWRFDRIGRIRLNHAFYRIARSVRFQAQREFSIEIHDNEKDGRLSLLPQFFANRSLRNRL